MAGAVGGRQFGSSYRAAGVAPKSTPQSAPSIATHIRAAGAFSYTVPAKDFYTVFAQGAGGAGGQSNSGPATGGSSGSAAKSARVYLRSGQTIAGSIGVGGVGGATNNNSSTAGGATTVTLPDGSSMSCPGGLPGFSAATNVPQTGSGAPAAPSGLAVEIGLAGISSIQSSLSPLGRGSAGGDTPTNALFLTIPGAPFMDKSSSSGGYDGFKGTLGSGGGGVICPGGNGCTGGSGGDGYVLILRG